MFCMFFFFFKQKTAYEMRISDWSSDVCSSDLGGREITRSRPSAHRREPYPGVGDRHGMLGGLGHPGRRLRGWIAGGQRQADGGQGEEQDAHGPSLGGTTSCRK